MIFSAKELIKISDIPERTFRRRLSQINKENLFQKKTLGKTFDISEAKIISSLIGFQERLNNYLQINSAK